MASEELMSVEEMCRKLLRCAIAGGLADTIRPPENISSGELVGMANLLQTYIDTAGQPRGCLTNGEAHTLAGATGRAAWDWRPDLHNAAAWELLEWLARRTSHIQFQVPLGSDEPYAVVVQKNMTLVSGHGPSRKMAMCRAALNSIEAGLI